MLLFSVSSRVRTIATNLSAVFVAAPRNNKRLRVSSDYRIGRVIGRWYACVRTQLCLRAFLSSKNTSLVASSSLYLCARIRFVSLFYPPRCFFFISLSLRHVWESHPREDSIFPVDIVIDIDKKCSHREEGSRQRKQIWKVTASSYPPLPISK